MSEFINKIMKKKDTFLHAIELILALIVLIGVFYAFIHQVFRLTELDWSLISTYVEFIEIILFLAIGVELARILISYNIESVIELLVFVLARKILLLQDSVIYLVLIIVCIILLFAAKKYLVNEDKSLKLD